MDRCLRQLTHRPCKSFVGCHMTSAFHYHRCLYCITPDSLFPQKKKRLVHETNQYTRSGGTLFLFFLMPEQCLTSHYKFGYDFFFKTVYPG